MKRLFRKGEVGQSIIILALGFIGLLAVVGITTDVSILFARFAQLRRAVDAASIAAAGQMRQDRSLATVSLTARQFIEFHGISPRNVFVESCENAPIEDISPGTPGLQAPVELTELDPEICTPDQRKLVRVTAQIDSPTVFLRLIGFGNIELEASAISETAVLDVVLVMDVSESMLNETTYVDWASIGQGIAYVPPRVDTRDIAWSEASPPDTILRRMTYDWDPSNPDPAARPANGVNGAADVTGFIPAFFDGGTGERVVRFWNDDTFDLATDAPTYVDPWAPPSVPSFGFGGAAVDPQDWYGDWLWQEHLLGVPQAQVNDRLWFPGAPGEVDEATAKANANVMDPADPATWGQPNWFYEVDSFVPEDVFQAYNDGEITIAPGSQRHPREGCRVRFYPYSTSLTVNDYLNGLYEEHNRDTGQPVNTWPARPAPNSEAAWSGFVPSFDYFGCCNDPGNGSVDRNGNITPGTSVQPDGRFDDLICQPFKQARDATRLFLERIDFVRGDRVGFVTFDRTAFIMDPDGENGDRTHMIEYLDGQYGAIETLNQYIGVRAEPNFYRWGPDGGWFWDDGDGPETQFSRGFDFDNELSIPIDYNSTEPSAVVLNNYPVAGNCELQNAALPYPFSRYATRYTFLPDGSTPPAGLPVDIQNNPSLRNVMTPDIYGNTFWSNIRTGATAIAGTGTEFPRTDPRYVAWTPGRVSYDINAGCRGTNIGAALREANNALTDPETTRREGAVWIMILLSDGAAGASDPARSRARDLDFPDPYVSMRDLDGDFATTYDPYPWQFRWWQTGQARAFGNLDRTGTNYYGYYGVCPPGGESPHEGTQMGELVLAGNEQARPAFPYCSDESVVTRNFCTPTIDYRINRLASVGIVGVPGNELNPQAEPNGFPEAGFGPGAFDVDYPTDPRELNRYDVDVGEYTQEESCSMLYDVDDYARDWADFVAGVGQAGFNIQGGLSATGDAVLPTIFTIGFGLNFENGTGTCDDNVEDCLGEELLRYIADVGDNFQLDTDYQQDWHDDGELNNSVADYGVIDPCEPADGGYDPASGINGITLRQAGESCGNYFNAPGRAELELVFDEIASRMFTRIAG